MASYHFTVKRGVKKSANYKRSLHKSCTPSRKHAAYIFREGQYTNVKQADDLIFTESATLPYWAKNAGQFWRKNDMLERANGTTYREYEAALPRELDKDQQIALVREFVEQEIGERHFYQWAIHQPLAALEGKKQPHVHIMFSERINDGIPRDPEQYFMRYNPNNPAAGGCQKSNTAKGRGDARDELIALRKRWADLQNAHLEMHGHEDRVDHRTLAAQGINREPERHLGPVYCANLKIKAAVLDLRKARDKTTKLGLDLEIIYSQGVQDDPQKNQFRSNLGRDTDRFASQYGSPYTAAFSHSNSRTEYRAPSFDSAMSDMPSGIMAKNQRENTRQQVTTKPNLQVPSGQVDSVGSTGGASDRSVELPRLRADNDGSVEQPELDFNNTDLVEPTVNVFELITEADEKEDSADIVNLNVDVQKEPIKDTGVEDSEIKSKQMRVEELANDLKIGWMFEFEIDNKKFQQEAQRLAELHVFNNLNIEAMVHASHGDETHLTENDKTILDRENLWWLIEDPDIDQEEVLEFELVPEFEPVPEPEPETTHEEEPKPELQLDIESGSDRIAYYLARSVTLTEERNAREIRLKANLKKLEDNLNNRQPSSIFIDDISYTTDPINIELVDVLKQLKDANTFDKAHPLQITDFLGSPILDHLRAISKLLKTVCIDVKNKFIELIDGITSLTFTTDQNRGKNLDRTKPSVSAPSLSLELDLRPSPYDNRKK